MNKKAARLRRAKKTRAKIRRLNKVRLTVHRSLQHIYAQLIASDGKVLAVASSLEKVIRAKSPYGGNIAVAQQVGKLIAEKAQKVGIKAVAFDRSGYKYHGRVKALADAAREGGIDF